MARRLFVAALCLLLVLPATVATAQSEQQADQDAGELDVYEAEVEPGDDVQLRKDGVDVIDVAPVEQTDTDKERRPSRSTWS